MYPVSLSRERLPIELRDVDTAEYEVTMAYDVRGRGIHLYLSGHTSTARAHWWFDWQSRGFWPVTLQADHEPFSIFADAADVLLGCRDGLVRHYREDYEVDDGNNEIAAYVYYGPVALNNDGFDGLLNTLSAVVAANGGDITWNAYVGDSHEALATATSAGTGTWSAGLTHREYVRRRGASFVVRLSNADADRKWAIEQALFSRLPGGQLRKA